MLVKENSKEIERICYLIGLRDLLELGFSFFFVGGILVRMPFHGQLSICFLQIILRSISIYLQYIVVIYAHLFFYFSTRTLESCKCYNNYKDYKIPESSNFRPFSWTPPQIMKSTIPHAKLKRRCRESWKEQRKLHEELL